MKFHPCGDKEIDAIGNEATELVIGKGCHGMKSSLKFLRMASRVFLLEVFFWEKTPECYPIGNPQEP